MGIVAEFARYQATLVNRFWATSAEVGPDTVLSLWRHRIEVQDGRWIYRDHLSRWNGAGNALFARHLDAAFRNGRPIRLVVATTSNLGLVESGGDASKAKNTFVAKPEWIGRVEQFDGDSFTIGFNRDGREIV